jgi:2-polyprenyl-3-methyl-5-hydroxy-6-metoxy-1,4-benzoquinol methylase
MPTIATPAEIRGDFDAMAPLMPEHLGPHEAWLLAQLPQRRERALEIGCGVGTVARRLAESFAHVTAIDFSPAMIAEAKRRRSSSDFVCAEMYEWLRDHRDAYDCIVTITTLHHVDLGDALRAIAQSLKPGGRLLALDVMRQPNPLISAVGMLLGFRWRPSKLRRAFWRHGRNETYLKIDEARRIACDVLPGAQVRAHFLFRYSIVWNKPARPAA